MHSAKPNRIVGRALATKQSSHPSVSSLVETFKSNYPGELLDADTTPSIRLLKGLKPGQSLKWVPWQYRLSSRQYQERMEAKSAQAVRSELQLLSQAFFDDTQRCALVESQGLQQKIANPCLTQPDPNIQELLSADRKLWAPQPSLQGQPSL